MRAPWPPPWGHGTAGPRQVANTCPFCFVVAAFSRVAKMRLHDLLKKQEETQVSHMKQWVAREAANPDALQEAGTFRYRARPEAPGRAAPWGVTGSVWHAARAHAVSGCGIKRVKRREEEKLFSPASCLQSFDYKNKTLENSSDAGGLFSIKPQPSSWE